MEKDEKEKVAPKVAPKQVPSETDSPAAKKAAENAAVIPLDSDRAAQEVKVERPEVVEVCRSSATTTDTGRHYNVYFKRGGQYVNRVPPVKVMHAFNPKDARRAAAVFRGIDRMSKWTTEVEVAEDSTGIA